jgi:hypothetical protein
MDLNMIEFFDIINYKQFFFLKALGPNLYTHFCHSIDTFIGLGLFSALVALNTQNAIKSYEEGVADHLGVSS